MFRLCTRFPHLLEAFRYPVEDGFDAHTQNVMLGAKLYRRPVIDECVEIRVPVTAFAEDADQNKEGDENKEADEIAVRSSGRIGLETYALNVTFASAVGNGFST